MRIGKEPVTPSQAQEPPGLRCPECGCPHFYTLWLRKLPGAIKRRKECRNCGWRLTTRERVES